VIGIEARGFIFAPALAYHFGAGFGACPKARNCGRMRFDSYDLNMGRTHSRFIKMLLRGATVLIADDLLAKQVVRRARLWIL